MVLLSVALGVLVLVLMIQNKNRWKNDVTSIVKLEVEDKSRSQFCELQSQITELLAAQKAAKQDKLDYMLEIQSLSEMG